MKSYRAKTKSNIELTISKFHETVSQGPLYILHLSSVVFNVDKHISNNKSVDDVEWVCLTCYKYLVKNKMAPL